MFKGTGIILLAYQHGTQVNQCISFLVAIPRFSCNSQRLLLVHLRQREVTLHRCYPTKVPQGEAYPDPVPNLLNDLERFFEIFVG